MYLHGSGALGDWRSPGSDVDVLVIVDDWPADTARRVADACRDGARRCPGAGLELSVVSARAAAAPMAPYPFLLHVAASGGMPIRIVDGAQRPGDDNLILHYLVCRAHGIAWAGPPSRDVIGPVDRPTVLRQLAAELRWARAEAPADYALLNACRALAYLADSVVLSKSEGAQWALRRGVGPAGAVTAALSPRSGGAPTADPPMERAFIDDAINALSTAALDAAATSQRADGR